MDRFFTAFSTLVAKWTGSHWTFAIVAVLVVVSPVTIGVQDTNLAISIATLLMVFVLQNIQNRDSAALHQT
jgi:low affinity Fe/Cu permease